MLTTRRMFFGGLLGGAAAAGVTVDGARPAQTMQPGDLLVLEHPGHLSRQAVQNIEESALAVVPPGVKVIVLEEGMRASLLRPQHVDRVVERVIERHVDVEVDGRALADAVAREARRSRLA